MNKLFFLISFLFFFALTFKAQQLSFFKPDNFNHIPSSVTYNIMQDGKGYIWFSTEAGLCKYNGNSIRVFETKNGLPEGATYTISEDKDGALWFTTDKNRILKYINDSLQEAFLSKEYKTQFKNNLEHIYLSKPIKDNLWLTSQLCSYIINMHTGKSKCIELKDTSNASYYFIKQNGALVHIKNKNSTSKLFYSPENVRNLKFTIEDGTKMHSFYIPLSGNDMPTWRVYTASNNSGESYIGVGNILITIHPDYTYEVQKVSNVIFAIYLDNDNGLWLGLQKGGIVYFPNPLKRENKIVSLPDLSVTGICEDNEEGIWCSTLEKGIFYCWNKGIIDHSNIKGLDKKSELLKNLDGKVFVSSEEDELIVIENNVIKKIPIPNDGSTVNSDIIKEGPNYIISNKGKVIYTDTLFRNFKAIQIAKGNYGINQLCRGKNGKIYGFQFGGLFEIQNYKIVRRIDKLQSPGKCILFTSDERLLLGTREGMCQIDLNNFSQNKIAGIDGVVSKIIEINGEIWVTTANNGIYTIKNKSVSHISDKLALTTRRFTDIKQDKNGDIWLASNIGIIHLKKAGDKYLSHIYNSFNGLFSNEIFALECNDTMLYASTYDGLRSFPLNYELKNSEPPKFRLNSIYVNNERVLKTAALQNLKYDQNSMSFNFDILTFKQLHNPSKLIYTLNEENKINYTDGNIIKLNNLEPGNYRLKVYALNNDGIRSNEPISIDFEIKKPFWKTAAFIILCIVFFCGIGFFVVKKIIKDVVAKEKERSRITKLIAEYQLSALRAQMNPHFIFNCINSIQRYILTNKPDQAYNYLSKFSKLIRLVLNYAEENLITLAEELEIVELYIELEQQRFENKFTYSISLPENINDTKVPAMILQPYVENAIWHGLMNVRGEGERHISIKVKKLDTVLEIIIEDNGVGREKAALFSPQSHKPKATSINNKRTEILNILSSNKGSITIEDIKNDKFVIGTRVTIHIPETENNE